MTGRLVLVVILLLAASFAAVAQESDTITVDDARPYDQEEFPRWARDLRRAEIVATGTLPLTLLASRLLYGLGRFAYFSIAGGALDPNYLPPLFAPPGAEPYTRTDNLWIIAGSVSLSGAIAFIDYLLGLEEAAPEQEP